MAAGAQPVTAGGATPLNSMASDENLMLEFQRGSRDAFTELFERYREPIYGYFRRRLEHPARAEDLAQETFVAVLRNVTRWEPRALFRTYLYGIALNLLRAERRKCLQEQPGEAVAAEPSAQRDSETGEWVRQAVGRLEEMDREVLMLREYEQLSYAEIAELLRIPVNTVRSRLLRARMALRDLLTGGVPMGCRGAGMRPEDPGTKAKAAEDPRGAARSPADAGSGRTSSAPTPARPTLT